MSPKIRQFGTWSIISTLLVSFILGAATWLGVQASQVPELQATFKTEIRHLNTNMIDVSNTIKETNTLLRGNRDVINKSVYRITELEKDCEDNKREIEKCKRFHDGN